MLKLNVRSWWKNLRTNREICVSVIASILITVAVFAAFAATYPEIVKVTFQSSGVIKTPNIEVYYDKDCQNPVKSIDWGMVEPGFSKNITIYIKNIGNTPITVSMNTSDWEPFFAEEYINISLIPEQTVVDPEIVAKKVLSLHVSKDVQGILTSFSCTITIFGVTYEGEFLR